MEQTTLTPTRRLERGDGPLAGVAAGLADYFAIDPVIVRLGLVATTLLGGPAVPIAYVAAVVIIPKGADEAPPPPFVPAPPAPTQMPTPAPGPAAPAPSSEPVAEPVQADAVDRDDRDHGPATANAAATATATDGAGDGGPDVDPGAGRP